MSVNQQIVELDVGASAQVQTPIRRSEEVDRGRGEEDCHVGQEGGWLPCVAEATPALRAIIGGEAGAGYSGVFRHGYETGKNPARHGLPHDGHGQAHESF